MEEFWFLKGNKTEEILVLSIIHSTHCIAYCGLCLKRYTHADALYAAGCDGVLDAVRTQTLCVLQDVICALSAADAPTLFAGCGLCLNCCTHIDTLCVAGCGQ